MDLFYQPDLDVNHLFLDQDEAKHCTRVMRKKIGDQIEVTNGKGLILLASIVELKGKQVLLEVIESEQAVTPPPITVAVAPTKNMTRMEWLVEKLVEIGVHNIDFIFTSRSIRKVIKLERIQAKCVSAMKQSRSAHLPGLQTHKFNEYCKQLNRSHQNYLAYLGENSTLLRKEMILSNQRQTIIIGPEGGFTEAEADLALQYGATTISLGRKRLRTETAALFGAVALHLGRGTDS